ncbi:MAG: hypothetical protein U5L45_14460 [Saprospiraceae bacterium]|nr:hypothetical protein [Saprospiraceae bacterium]
MKATFLRSAMAVIMLIAAQSVKAQAVITEYFDVKEAFKIDLSDKKAAKAVYSKGVLDIDWNGDKRVLAISYDPKQTKIEDIMSNISMVTGQNLSAALNTKKRN